MIWRSYLFTFGFLLALLCTSCKTKEQTTNSPPKPAVEGFKVEQQWASGTVTTRFAEQGCPFLIEVNGTQEALVIDPVQLDAVFQQDQLKVLFQYRPVKIPRKGSCSEGLYALIEAIKPAD